MNKTSSAPSFIQPMHIKKISNVFVNNCNYINSESLIYTCLILIHITYNLAANEMSFPREHFMLSGDNMQQLISISIADDDVQTADDREFTLIVASTVVSHLRVINPMVLTVIIKDNDTGEVIFFIFLQNSVTLSFTKTCVQNNMILVHTEVIYGIREVNPLTPMTVQEGEDITITVGLLGPDSPNLDYDFVVGYTVKILYGGVHGNATGILYYVLHLVHSILL